MAEQVKTVISDSSGDGDVLKGLPAAVAGIARAVELKSRNARHTRLLRTCARLLPALRRMEEINIEDEEERVLTGLRFSEALKDARAIERCLLLFQSAWESGLFEIRTGNGKVLKAGDRKTVVGTCGMTVRDVEYFLLYEAARRIMKKHSKFKLNIPGFLSGPEVLPKIKIIKDMEPNALAFLQKSLGKKFSAVFNLDDTDKLTAISKLKIFHVIGLEKAMAQKFPDVLDWETDRIEALAEAFTCPEQVNDLGEFIVLIKDPQAFHALAAWERRDITEKVNSDKEARGQKAVKGPVYDTDIALVNRMLGRDFSILMEQPASVLVSTGRLIDRIKAIESKNDRADTVELFKKFVNRYLSYLSGEAVEALHMAGDGETIEITEALGILEGLWNKERVGRKFFEEHLKTQTGVTALNTLVIEFIDMKKRGSIKPDSDVASLITTSDLFDGALSGVMN